MKPTMVRLGLASTLASLAACFDPAITDGGFQCGPEGLCPEGYACTAAGRCSAVKDPSAAAPPFGGELGDLDLTGKSGALECSTKTGAITLRGGGADTMVVTPSASGFNRAQPTEGPPLAIWSFVHLAVPQTVSLIPSADSDAVPVFVGAAAVDLDGAVDWHGRGGLGGVQQKAGAASASGVASGGQPGSGDGGGGGGGHSTEGAAGNGAGAGAGGASYGVPQLAPMHVGSGGGGGGGSGGRGGDGGGGVVILSLGTVTLNGKIDVSGTNGYTAGAKGGGGGGGGSGGGILVSGGSVVLGPGHELLARGGGGGMGRISGLPGGAGAPGRIWIGGAVSTMGAIIADPPPTQSGTALAAFPSP